MALFRDVKRAEEIHFCNRGTSMSATNVQDAILEIARLLNLAVETETTATVNLSASNNMMIVFRYYDENNTLQEVVGDTEQSFNVYPDSDIYVMAMTNAMMTSTLDYEEQTQPDNKTQAWIFFAPAAGESGNITIQ